ncbi:Uncharacterised protein [Mycobacteroides abscessus subsp. abscessus]|uniref:hypothetical protein n=1 Tax=Mycobacteroides abscessus TaxID=36809 RepID=UPI0009C4D8D5|nr:hypothetical protein [Mycobacteroides abscessus]SKM37380.1 Uncharacterised protein [Mycobacteroides abscessus subsp. abscessus]
MALTDQAGLDMQERLIRAEIEARETERIRAEATRRAAADQDWAEREAARRVASEDAHFAAEAERREQFHNGQPAADTDAKPAAESKAQPDAKAETPKPDTPKPSPKPDTATAAAGDGKRVWNAGRIGTQMGVPPSAVRNLRAGEPVAGLKGLAKAQWGAGQHWAGKAGTKLGAKLADKGLQGLGKAGLKGAARLLPVVGSIYAGYNAWRDFKSGDYVGAALNLLGVIPGPVGWVALGAATIWDLTGWGHRYGEWDQPDGTNTHILQGAAKDVSGVKELDAELRAAQAAVFSFQDGPTGTVWDSAPPKAIRLDTEEVTAAATAWLSGLSDHFAAIDKVMVNAGEQYFTEQRAALAPHLTAMAALKGQVSTLVDQLAAASDGAKTGYNGVLQANKAARQQLSADGELTDQGPATSMKTAVQTGSSAISAANDKLTKLFAETPPPVVAARTGTAPGTRTETPKPQEQKPTPAPVTPSVATPAAVTPSTGTKPETTTKANDDLTKLLSQLGQNKAPTTTPTSNPLGNTGTGGLGGGSPLGSQGLGGGQGGGTPLSQSKPDTSTKSEPKKLVDDKPTERKTAEKKLDDKSLTAPKPEQTKSAVPGAEKPATAPVTPVATPAPAAGPTPAQQNAAAAAKAEEPSKEVDVKGNKTTFPDAKTAKMAELLSKADPTHPMSLADAAKSAGLTPPTPGQDPGKQVAPTDAKPGDILVASGKNYMLLGDGKFYDLSDYKVVGASEIPQNLGDRAGYFHLVDPNPGQPAGQGVPGPQTPPAAPHGPVSPQGTDAVQHQVPGATGTPQGPVDASPAPAAPGGVPAAGTPGVPKPGAPGTGPANSAATDTGVGVGGPSTGGQKLDPGAVR